MQDWSGAVHMGFSTCFSHQLMEHKDNLDCVFHKDREEESLPGGNMKSG